MFCALRMAQYLDSVGCVNIFKTNLNTKPMETTSVKFYSLTARQAKTYLTAALFIAGNIALPQLCHLVPDGGRMLLPIYFLTLLGAYKYGWRVGLLTAILSPALNALLFGMPAAAALPAIIFKSVAAALAASWAASRTGNISIWTMAAVVLGCQLVGILFEWALSGSFAVAVQDFRMGLAGMVVQIVGVWALLRYIFKN